MMMGDMVDETKVPGGLGGPSFLVSQIPPISWMMMTHSSSSSCPLLSSRNLPTLVGYAPHSCRRETYVNGFVGQNCRLPWFLYEIFVNMDGTSERLRQ